MTRNTLTYTSSDSASLSRSHALANSSLTAGQKLDAIISSGHEQNGSEWTVVDREGVEDNWLVIDGEEVDGADWDECVDAEKFRLTRGKGMGRKTFNQIRREWFLREVEERNEMKEHMNKGLDIADGKWRE